MKKWRYYILTLIVFMCLVIPVSADLLNGYYRVAPYVGQGATIFIGEQGLNITPAMLSANTQAGTVGLATVGWWASAADLSSYPPTVSINLAGRETYFTVTQFEFDGYEGQWYLVNPAASNTALAPVFNVKAPKFDLTIRNPDLYDGADVSGTSVPIGTRLQFQIGTNMYTVLDPMLRYPVYGAGSGVNTSGYLDIKVKCDNGTTLTRLYDNQLSFTLIALNVTTQPYTWGRANRGLGPGILYVWNTSTYPAGTYTVSGESKLNNMQTNYLSGGAAYTGRTVSQATTITLVGGIPPVTSASTKIGTYNPDHSIWYLDYNGNGIWEPGIDKSYLWGAHGYQPVTGNWDGSVDGKVKIGTYNPDLSIWYLDYNGNGIWEPGTDKVYNWGAPGYQPVTGDWNGDGKVKIGTYNPTIGIWYLDYNGNGIWEPGIDKVYNWGAFGYAPVVGKWS